jgi:hypothetical protein
LANPQSRITVSGEIFNTFAVSSTVSPPKNRNSTTRLLRFLLTNPPGYFFRYNGMLVVMEKRWSRGWQALASYTLSKSEGLRPTSGSFRPQLEAREAGSCWRCHSILRSCK